MKTISNSFNNFFKKIGANLALEAYINKANTKLHKNPFTEEEFLEAFKLLKISKAPGFDQVDVNLISQI